MSPKAVDFLCEAIPSSRAEARLVGAPFYFNGPCKRGHFSVRNTSKSECVECKRESGAARYEREREKIIARATEWNRENKDRRKEINSASYGRNVDKIKEKRGERHSSWYYGNHELNKVRKSVNQHNRKSKLLLGGSFTAMDVAHIRAMQGDRCAYCRVALSGAGQIDHIVPVSKGGLNVRRNLQITCDFCNLSKHNQDPIDFARKLGRLL